MKKSKQRSRRSTDVHVRGHRLGILEDLPQLVRHRVRYQGCVGIGHGLLKVFFGLTCKSARMSYKRIKWSSIGSKQQ